MLISGQADLRSSGHQHEVRSQRHLGTGTQREAIHRGDDRFLEEHQSLADDLFALQILAPVEGGAAGLVFLRSAPTQRRGLRR